MLLMQQQFVMVCCRGSLVVRRPPPFFCLVHVTVHVTEAVKGAHMMAKTTLLCEHHSQGFDSPTGYQQVKEKSPTFWGFFVTPNQLVHVTCV